MKIDALELQRLATAQSRVDLYSGIHKALRACMADALLALGRADLDDPASLEDAMQRVEVMLRFCETHLEHENRFIHPAIESRAAGASEAVTHQHGEHQDHIEALRACVQALRMSGPAMRPVAAQLVYRQLALFIADNFQHMHTEETAHNAVLWARYSDTELAAIQDSLVQAIPPQDKMMNARWLVPSLNAAERLALLAGIRGKMPAPAFDAIMGTVRPHLSQDEWRKLCAGLGIAAVPGLVQA